MRVATFNIENLDDGPAKPNAAPFEERAVILRPMLERLRADVICFQEVHGQNAPDDQPGPRSLRALTRLLEGTRYESFELSSTTLKGKPDVERFRNLVVASAPEYTIEEVREIQNTLVNPPMYSRVTADGAQEAMPVRWERPTLYVRLRKGVDDPLHIMNIHFKSKNPTPIPGQGPENFRWATPSGWAEGYFVSSMKRVGAALEVRLFIDAIFDVEPEAKILVCGDFNAEPDEVPAMAIRGLTEDTGNPELNGRVMHPAALSIAESRRFTLYHHGKGNLLDHMVVSRRMMASFVAAEIHNEMIHDESIAFATDNKFPESDHAPMVAEFAEDAMSIAPLA
ncbi:endonuclease/exonuclease/phosphatase family protein [Roseovarius sp. Pro17]|uniref:endonuclease/exonuclease/phosphatase family protein n=1 Tax=Roseovarius sp. Pro17 TaxID=3108175 RepID=UPI002D76B738|nr:endonuclease/exonuclease/phosphatase family protein [Roseovarius sp. Pro17]